eukprot:TRINITY_DN113894_c0_g1_i1.p1 TRINITY_DN113894_c0_g1~~TRINITY_DN113894_c0_g1_i1.p1  ORF type:complete len:233 (+),score=41.96 TRINITY_DN113894_c0_g1_i1:26-724(+)
MSAPLCYAHSHRVSASPWYLRPWHKTSQSQLLSRCAEILADRGRRSAMEKVVGATAAAASFSSRRRRNNPGRSVLAKASGTMLEVEVEKLVEADRAEAAQELSQGAWIVLVHAEVRNCRMPFCKLPGLGKYVCSCLRDNVPPPEPGFGSALQASGGTCTRSPPETAAYLRAAVPVLSEGTAWDIATRLVQSAEKNTVGSAAVIGGPRERAEQYRQRLSSYGFWASVVPMTPE